jgi:hypothetical protein
MLTAIDGSQSSVFAQNSKSTLNSPPITPASETSDSGSEDAAASDDDSSGSEDAAASDDGDVEETSSSEEEEAEDDFEQTNPLLEQIRESVSRSLSATGMNIP